jgi:hypothetical protein
MLLQLRRTVASIAIGTAAFAFSSSALAASLELFVNGVSEGYYVDADLGCSSGGGPITSCVSTGLPPIVAGDLRLDSWSLTLDSDPVISGTANVTNLNPLLSQQFTMIFTLPVAPPILPSSLIGGSIQGGMTDNTGNGATVSTAPGSAFYTARIDGSAVQSLYPHAQSFGSGAFLSGNIPNVAFGTPIPSAPGPAVLFNIGIVLDFVLTPGDSASFTSNFVVQPVPEPSTAALVALGLGALALVRRQRS